jgi:predicted ester cyclase
MSLIHVKNGKIAEEWVETDDMVTAQQLGFTVTPPTK